MADTQKYGGVFRGHITTFNRQTWRGTVKFGHTLLNFHGSSVRGYTIGFELAGKDCDVLLNQDGRLVSLEVR